MRKIVEVKKTLLFSALYFLLNMGYSFGLLSANALLIHKTGTSPLFYVYLGGSLLALIFAGIFYFLIDRFSRRKVFYLSFALFGSLVFFSWGFLKLNPDLPGGYLAVRIFFYAVFVLTLLEFWLMASDAFTNFEARRRFPYLVASGILGGIAGGFFIHEAAILFHAVNFILLWAGILLLVPFLLLTVGRASLSSRKRYPSDLRTETSEGSSGKSKTIFSFGLAPLLFVFWLGYNFFSFGTDYIFNNMALREFGQEDLLTAFFGKVSMAANAVVLVYQFFLAVPLTLRYGVDRTIFVVPLMIVLGMGLICFSPSLATVSIAEGMVFFFADFVGEALLQPVLNVFPYSLRGRIKVFSEGFGRPAGILLLLFIAILGSFTFRLERMSGVLFATALVFLIYPFLFQRAYLRHLLACLRSRDLNLVSNAVQALGERNKKKAVPPSFPFWITPKTANSKERSCSLWDRFRAKRPSAPSSIFFP